MSTIMNPREQALRERLETRDFHTSFLVEAGAGAGKSYTLCQRILHQLLAGQEPASIAAITFTDKAALELREKLDRLALEEDRRRGESTRLAEAAEGVHISTIHSFCQTALRLFPLEIPPDFQVMADEGAEAAAFFRRWIAGGGSRALPRFEAFGGSARELAETFLAMAGEGALPARVPETDAWRIARQRALEGKLEEIRQTLRARLLPHERSFDLLPQDLAQAIRADRPGEGELLALRRTLLWAWKRKSRPQRLNALLLTGRPETAELLRQYLERNPRKIPPKPEDQGLPLLLAALDGCRAELDPEIKLLGTLEQIAGHDLAMDVLASALEDYQSWRRERGRLTFSDLLTRTRDLLRDAPEARALLHRRYRVFYVDEFQDTDPVQAEILFLLTDREGRERDWRRCRPAEGSLFLVGDPKQAIYRFRGADLDVYKQVKDLFQDPAHPLGEVVSLRANFRSSPEICRFADRVFAPRDGQGRILTPEEQAENRSCEEVSGRLDDGRFQANYVPMEAQQADPEHPMVFRYPARLAGKAGGDEDRAARFIQRAVAGGAALPDGQGRMTPVRYGDFLILTRRRGTAGLYLEALAALGVPAVFTGLRLLGEHPWAGRLEAWLAWLLEPDSETALIRLLEVCFGLDSFEGLRRLKAAGSCALPELVGDPARREQIQGDPDLAPWLEALEAAERVLSDRRALPPLAFLEKLWEERLLRAGDASTERERRRQYGDFRQLLHTLRQRPEGDFPALARTAMGLCQGILERELPLTPEPDAVRIMNLHKAKGLEGRIVMLVRDSGSVPPPRRAGSIFAVTRRTPYGGSSLLYAPQDWPKALDREERYLAAERVRLDYVAATRAKHLLLIAQEDRPGGAWEALAAQAEPVQEADPRFGDLFAPLVRGDLPPLPVQKTAPGPAPQDLTGALAGRIWAQSRPCLLHASPSTLDRGRDPELLSSYANARTEPAELRDGEAGSRGADWGTAVHRCMELCVSRGALTPQAAGPLIRQALRETLPPLSRLAGERGERLFGGPPPRSGQEAAELLARRLEAAVSFWFDGASPLRRLAAEGRPFCELPFRLCLTDPEDALRRYFLRGQEEDPGRALTVSGILDLALLTEAGWWIVDYKTDRLRTGETREDYRARMREEYGAQLGAYVRVLGRLWDRPVFGARLCLIPLGGELMEIGDQEGQL